MRAEPHKIKTVKNLNITTYQERSVLLRDSFLNTFNIPSNKVTYEMISRGTSAKSQEQESGSLVGDETYAGSRNFEKLQENVEKILGHTFVCPTHNLYGSIKLIIKTMTSAGQTILSNSSFPELMARDCDCSLKLLGSDWDDTYSGNSNMETLFTWLSNNNSPFIYIDAYSDGYRPMSLQQIKKIRALADQYHTTFVLDVSGIVELALYIRNKETDFSNISLSTLVKEIASTAHVCIIDAAQDPRCNTGGLIASNAYERYEKYMNEVVVYEGLHTYGGMAGRAMESFARGLEEMILEPQAQWIVQQVELLSDLLKTVPGYKGADGYYIKADDFLPHLEENQSNALAAMLYIKAGIRCITEDKYNGQTILPVQIPRLGFTNEQIAFLARAIKEVYEEREKLTFFKLLNKPEWIDQAKYKWNNPLLDRFNYECEAYRISTIEYVGVTTLEQRREIIDKVGYNTFLLPSKDVSIDLLTDSGTCAQTTKQWSKFNEGDETPASSKDYFDMTEALKEVTGYKYIIPTHQGRAAEHIMSQVLISNGIVPGNMYFTTTKLHQEMAGGTFADVICDEAHDPVSDFAWKGNIDISKIEKILQEHGEGSIPYISFEFSVNLAGGQPVHMDNAREVYLFCKERNIPVMFDATRAVENAYMIRKKDSRYQNTPIKEILRELFSYGDGCTVSSKKDYLVNIGGFLAIREDEVFHQKALSMLRIYEGSRTTGGMSAGDMAMHAEGVKEMLDINYIMARVEQTQYLGARLKDANIPVVEPIGTHAVFLDAKRFLPHIDQDNYPAQALASALYVESGIRAMERGNVSSGRNKKTGENYRPSLELVRLTIPRRVYTNNHMDLVADSIINLYKNREQIKGLDFVYEPENLRFFQGKFKPKDRG